jgi:4-amino-4-deoxy-L-arabinose transferase-like glycosyltransferase
VSASIRAWVGRIPPALLIVLAVGVAVRISVWVAAAPVELNIIDSERYVDMAAGELFSDPARPIGYSVFLRAAHAITDQLWWTLLLQNLLGIASAIVLYATVRRLGAPVWAGAVAAAAILLSLDQAVLEHTLLSEPPFTFLLCCSIYCALRALEPPVPVRGWLQSRDLWLIGAGLSLGGATWVRGVGLALIPFVALWLALALRGGWQTRLGAAATAGGTAAALVLVYAALHDDATGTFGMTQVDGRALYARSAPFADCSEFDPPPGTESLCESSPPEQRYGHDFYAWLDGSPAWPEFGLNAEDDARLGEFGRSAIVAQPLDYAEAVVTDVLRYFIPGGYDDDRLWGGPPHEQMRIDHPDETEPITWAAISSYYDVDGQHVYRGIVSTIGDLQPIIRVGSVLMTAALLLGAAGLWLTEGRVRAGIALLLGMGLLLVVFPALIGGYAARYLVPAGGPMIAAGALGAWAVARRREQLR